MNIRRCHMVWTFIFFLTAIISCRRVDPPLNETYHLNIPDKFPPMPIPADNPMTVKGVELGRKLFYDPILSVDNTVSCSGCHQPEKSFSDGLQFSTGVNMQKGKINTISLVNVGWAKHLFWNGRAMSLEEQALQPIQNPEEMNEKLSHVISKLKADRKYVDLFRLAFGTNTIDEFLIAKAIAQFERTFISSGSLYDRYYVQGEDALQSASQLRGSQIFQSEKGDCFHCHGGIFTNNSIAKEFSNNGLDSVIDGTGYSTVTHNPDDDGKFKVPTLRNLIFSAPYMHDGRFKTLEEVIDFYSDGLKYSRTLDPIMQKFNRVEQGGLKLSAQDKKDLIAFLLTMTDSSYVNNPAYSKPLH